MKTKDRWSLPVTRKIKVLLIISAVLIVAGCIVPIPFGGIIDEGNGGPTDGGPTDGGPTDGGPTDGGPTGGDPTGGGPTDGTTTPSAVTFTSGTAIAHEIVRLEWVDPTGDNFSHLLIQWTPTDDDGSTDNPLRIDAGVQQATIYGLVATTNYSFTAVSVGLDASMSASGPAITVTPDNIDTDAPGGVTGLIAQQRSDTEIALTWADPTDIDFESITVTATVQGETTPLIDPPMELAPGTQQATITGLTQGTQFQFTVTSTDTSGNTTDTQALQWTLPTVVTDPSTTLAVNGGVDVSWTAPVGNFTDVAITWDPADGTTTQPVMVANGTETASIAGLTDAESYTFTLTTQNIIDANTTDESAQAATVSATADAAPPSEVTTPGTTTPSTGTDAGDIVVSWTNPNDDDFSHTVLSWTDSGTSMTETVTIMGADTPTHTIEGQAILINTTVTLKTVDTLGHESTGTTVTVAPQQNIALFSAGQHAGGFGFALCQITLDDTTNDIGVALKARGYTTAVMFGSTTDYGLYNLPTDTDALGFTGPTDAVLRGRNVSAYTATTANSVTTVTETATFAASAVSVSIGNMVDTTGTNLSWQHNAGTVLEAFGVSSTGTFWSFTESGSTAGQGQYGSTFNETCLNATDSITTGITGNSANARHGALLPCSASSRVICAAR